MGWPTGLQHSLHEIKSYAGFAFVLDDREIIRHIVVAHVAGQGVPLLIGQPFVLGGVCMSSPDVFALQVLQLAVNVVSIAHISAIKGAGIEFDV